MVRNNLQKRPNQKGFSLVELLAVMAVVAALLSLAAVGVNKMGKSQGLTSGVAIAEGIFAQARSLAIAKGTQTRVVIHGNLNDSETQDRRRYRKMMMVMFRDVNPDTGKTELEWTSAGQPVFLPEQVYFSEELSKRDVQVGGKIRQGTHRMGGKKEPEVNTYFYEFNGQGICTTPGTSFILEAGARPPGVERAIQGKGNSQGGFVVWRNGNTSTIRDPSQITEN